MPDTKNIDVLIIGAGLTGLSTAHFIKKNNIDFRVIDRNPAAGGVINTHTENGFVYETGPNTGVLGSSELIEIFEDLKGLCELETANKNAKKRYILKNGRWEPLPGGLAEGLKTPLFTMKDKFRLLGEPFRSKGKYPHETLSQLVIRRMGKSFLDYAIDPFIIGVYAGDPNILIPKYALPKLYNLEQNYGSFIGGAIKKQFEKKTEAEKKITREVFSARGGLSNLVNAMQMHIGQEKFVFNVDNLEVRPSETIASKNESTVDQAVEGADGYKVTWKNDGVEHQIIARNIVFTGGSFEVPTIFPFLDKKDTDKITNLLYARILEITLGFNSWEGMDLDGFGGLIPSKEKRDILGILFMSTLFEGRAPESGALLTVFMGGIRNTQLTYLNDGQIQEVVEREVKDLMGLKTFNPDLFKITRYNTAIPQYEVSSGERFHTIDKLEKTHPGLILGGNMRDGIGMADRAKQGRMLAQQIINRKR
jgi:protoporphyrinogen/coproporphyrinogen III oxidase